MYEWRTGSVPKSIEKTPYQYNFGDDKATSTAAAVVVDADANQINFDLDDVVLDEVRSTHSLIHSLYVLYVIIVTIVNNRLVKSIGVILMVGQMLMLLLKQEILTILM